MSPEELTIALETAENRVSPHSLTEEEYEIPKDLCWAILHLHAVAEQLRAQLEDVKNDRDHIRGERDEAWRELDRRGSS